MDSDFIKISATQFSLLINIPEKKKKCKHLTQETSKFYESMLINLCKLAYIKLKC